MSNYLYRLARFAFRRQRLVLAAWLLAASAAIAVAHPRGGKTNDTFTIPGTEAQNRATVLQAKLPAFSGGQSTIVFATSGAAKVTDPADRAAIESAMAKLKSIPQVLSVTTPFQSHLVSPSGQIALGQVQWSAPATSVKDSSLNAVKAAMTPVQAHGVQVAYNGSVYPGWRTVISEAPELIGLIIAFGILMVTFGAFVAAGMPILGAIIGVITTMLGFAGPKVARFTRLPLLGAHAERVARRSAANPDSSAGAGWARFVVRHRVPVLIGGIALLGVLAIPALTIHLGLPSGASQPAGNTQRQAYDLTTEGFGAGFNGALLIVAQDVSSPADTQQIAGALAKLPDVVQVTPVTTQNGISLIKLIPRSGPSDLATTALVHTIRGNRAAIEGQTGAHILVGGTTASNIDVSAKLSSALPIFLVVVVGLAFILLTFAFRTILVPIKSILGFLLSMAAALGAQVAIFQWGWGQHIFGITPAETISFLPIIMLAIIFGLSSDYEVFVVSRIKEEYTKNGDARRAVQRGTGLSARVVTAAAMIMFSIFVAFMFTNDPTIKAIGFSFAAGVFLDAFVVRLTLVPAVMAIIGSRIWYHPRWFARHVPDPDIEGQRLENQLTRGELATAGTSARQG